jgi:hypothetical protein
MYTHTPKARDAAAEEGDSSILQQELRDAELIEKNAQQRYIHEHIYIYNTYSHMIAQALQSLAH